MCFLNSSEELRLREHLFSETQRASVFLRLENNFVLLEFKSMSDVTDQYVTRAKRVAIAQYASIKSALEQTLDRQGWIVSQRSFIAGVLSLNEKDLQENLAYFKVPQAGIESTRSKLAFNIFDEYANILKGMYSTRFNGRPKDRDVYAQTDSAPG